MACKDEFEDFDLVPVATECPLNLHSSSDVEIERVQYWLLIESHTLQPHLTDILNVIPNRLGGGLSRLDA